MFGQTPEFELMPYAINLKGSVAYDEMLGCYWVEIVGEASISTFQHQELKRRLMVHIDGIGLDGPGVSVSEEGKILRARIALYGETPTDQDSLALFVNRQLRMAFALFSEAVLQSIGYEHPSIV